MVRHGTCRNSLIGRTAGTSRPGVSSKLTFGTMTPAFEGSSPSASASKSKNFRYVVLAPDLKIFAKLNVISLI